MPTAQQRSGQRSICTPMPFPVLGLDVYPLQVVGYTFCFGLMGVLAVQIFVYFTRFPNDRTAMKAFVAVILLLELTITVFVYHDFWVSAATDEPLQSVGAGLGSGYLYPFLAPLTGLVLILIMMVSLLQLASISYLGFTRGLFPAVETLTVTTGEAVASPSQITVTISPFIGTGLITTLAALIELILGMVYYETMYHIAVFYIISKLYANCLLASLNVRLIIRNPSKPYTTVAVWDDSETRLQTGHAQTRESHVMQIIAEVRTDMETDDCSDTSQKNRLLPQAHDAVDSCAPAAEWP
ncbi:hypothetical protein HYDPIDRAFT_30962 [Hydnomerulius pinastri MD-312]|uniref:DUF6534 domain-containing protein n=1 Tax=Hydnomerulius pinastri MD-312 TaxID=994086 RepID=A0A0C9V883_9AGAM|nr:hypothetical protein HYDPIDRAFT_30962 [Hydnomerulius pinastri MD-312]